MRRLVPCALAIAAVSAAVAAPRTMRVTDLAWMAGCWAYEDRAAGSGEQWMPPAGGTMLGVSRIVVGGETVSYEYVRIHETEDGGLIYEARPSDQPGASFRATRVAEGVVNFENPQHDFPQKIAYQLESEDVLVAWIGGPRDGEMRFVNFPMRRIDCEEWGAR